MGFLEFALWILCAFLALLAGFFLQRDARRLHTACEAVKRRYLEAMKRSEDTPPADEPPRAE